MMASIGGQEILVASELSQGKSLAAQSASNSDSLALANSTIDARGKLEAVVNRDILTLSNLITESGQNAGIVTSIVSVTPGPGPTLPRGSPLHPSSIIFSVKMSGNYKQVLTAVSLLENIPAASTLESAQLSPADSSGMWNAYVTVGVVTSTNISS